jgi:H+/Cl- antiporter ClcA
MHCFNSRRIRLSILLAIGVAAGVAVALQAPIAQLSGYNVFADQRLIWGVPNFWNVVSNLPFFVVGLAGTLELVRRQPQGMLASL